MRSFTLLSLALSLFTFRAGATLFDLESTSNPSVSITNSKRALFDPESTSSAPHSGLSAFSKRATTKISSYSGPTKGHATFYGNDGSGESFLLFASSC